MSTATAHALADFDRKHRRASRFAQPNRWPQGGMLESRSTADDAVRQIFFRIPQIDWLCGDLGCPRIHNFAGDFMALDSVADTNSLDLVPDLVGDQHSTTIAGLASSHTFKHISVFYGL